VTEEVYLSFGLVLLVGSPPLLPLGRRDDQLIFFSQYVFSRQLPPFRQLFTCKCYWRLPAPLLHGDIDLIKFDFEWTPPSLRRGCVFFRLSDKHPPDSLDPFNPLFLSTTADDLILTPMLGRSGSSSFSPSVPPSAACVLPLSQNRSPVIRSPNWTPVFVVGGVVSPFQTPFLS